MEAMNQSTAKAVSRAGRLRRAVAILSIPAVFVVARMALPRLAAGATSPAVVTMTDAPPAFVPAKLTIKVGDEVDWRNTGQVMHSVTANPPLPAGAQSFDSGFMPPGATFTHKFTVAGTYHYVCMPHANSGMVGEIVVAK